MLGAAIIARTGREGRESRFATLLPTADLVKPQLSLSFFLAKGQKDAKPHHTHTLPPPVGSRSLNYSAYFHSQKHLRSNSATLATARKIILCEALSVCNRVSV